MLSIRLSKAGLAAVAAATLLSACAAQGPAKMAADAEPAAPSEANNDLYEVVHEGRIYVFDRMETYREFLSVGETPYRLTRIGAGPKGATLVFGLHADDKQKQRGIPAVDLYDGKLKPADNFYAEMRREGRIYVFTTLEDMAAVRQLGHPAYFYTEIGSGPQGETVVYVLNSTNKKKKPEALIARFRQLNRG